MNLTITPIRKINATASISYLPGIGRHTPKALGMYGIKTIVQFSRFTDQEVTALLGKSGKKLLATAKKLSRA